MENVVAFNNELSGLYDTKPPISKAKMAAITKAAMRAIKFYKHVVQSVEKFILKCKPEYKVPGLYVIDSIVRQSRHQFGAEKDVFAPRFARNIKETFANLFRCAPEDKSRIIRVLNLWQKNNVFAPEVIQPIFDLADPNHPIHQMPSGGTTSAPSGPGGIVDLSSSTSNGMITSTGSMDINLVGLGNATLTGSGDDKHSGLPDLSSLSHESAQNVLDNSTLRQLEHMQQYLQRKTSTTCSSVSKARDSHAFIASYGGIIDGTGSGAGLPKSHHFDSYSKFAKTSNEIAYDDDGDGISSNSPQHGPKLLDNNNLQQLLNDPNVLRQLQTLRNFQEFKQQETKQNKLSEMRLQEEAFEKHLQNVLKGAAPPCGQDIGEFNKDVEFVSEEKKIEVINLDGNDSRSPTPDRDRYKRRRSRSHSRSRDRGGRDRDRRRRSRSRSRSPRSARRRSPRDRERSTRDKERDREQERERRKKGLPDIKKEHLSVCSTTLWVGHLSKLVYQEELSDTFGEYGDIVSIDQIVPRGCAFIVMNRRQDAHKAMQGLKNHKLQGRAITISWAAGKGVKNKEWKDFWDLDLGVTYIPWNKLDENTDFDSLEEGGMFDEDSMPTWMKDKISKLKSLKEKSASNEAAMSSAGNMIFNIDTTQPPPGPPPGGPPSMMPMVPGQFSMAPPMSGPPRMLGTMTMPLSGIPLPPNLVPSMPPPHTIMMSTGMIPPGFPPMPGAGQVGGGTPMSAHLGLPPGPTQFPPPLGSVAGGAIHTQLNIPGNTISDDQMDIEMEEDDTPGPTSQVNFNQPPPMFVPGINSTAGSANDAGGEMFNRDRNRSNGASASTRWGGRGNDANDGGGDDRVPRWHENGPPKLNDVRGGGRGNQMNIPVLDMHNPPQRPDFMNAEFDNRGGPGPRGVGSRSGNQNGELYTPNMQNRFNQPTSLLQMRIPPPNAFNPRMGGPVGPPMFMRGGGQGGPGGRQQSTGFFNPRNPFDRDIGGRSAGRVSGRGGSRVVGRGGRMGGPGNWSDEEGDESNNFKRRGGPLGNRFRDHDSPDERMNRERSGRRSGMGERGGTRDRHEQDQRDSDYEVDANRGVIGNLRSSIDTGKSAEKGPSNKSTAHVSDTEEDWDLELQDYNTPNPSINEEAAQAPATITPNESTTSKIDKIDYKDSSSENTNTEKVTEPEDTLVVDHKKNEAKVAGANTPLYDELPAPVTVTSKAPSPPLSATAVERTIATPVSIPSPTVETAALAPASVEAAKPRETKIDDTLVDSGETE